MTEIAPAAAFAAGEPDSASLPVRAADFAVEIVSTRAGLDALAAEWQALERLSSPGAIFQSHAQLRIWARHFAAGDKGSSRLHIAVVRRGRRAILILPLAFSGPLWLRIARLAGNPVAQYSELLLDPSEDARGAFDAALASLRSAGIASIVLRGIADDSHLLRLAAPHLRAPTARGAAPFAALGAHADYEAYLGTLSKNMRKGLRNRSHHLESAGNVSFDILSGAEARSALDDAMSLKRRWLIQHGALSTAFLDPATRACLLDLAEDAATGSLVTRLSVDGSAAAIRFGFEHRGTYFAYLSAYDEAFAQLSPGKMLMHAYLSRFKERKLDRIDMLPPSGRHKTDWCTERTGVADYTLPLTRAGRAYAELYQERLRPALRRTWSNLPVGVRSLAAALLIGI